MASKYNQFEKFHREIGVSIALSDIEKRLECLKGKDQKPCHLNFKNGSQKVKM